MQDLDGGILGQQRYLCVQFPDVHSQLCITRVRAECLLFHGAKLPRRNAMLRRWKMQQRKFLLHKLWSLYMLTLLQGVCDGGSVGGQITSWIDDNKALVIGISSAIGGLILLGLLGCLWRCCRRPRKVRKIKARNMSMEMGGWAGPYPPRMQNTGWNGNQGWPQGPPRTNSVRYA